MIKKQPAANRRGAVVVEFAIIAPVFFMVIFAMFEFSRLNVLRHTADNAAYEAARLAIVPGATAADAENEANRILRIVGARDAVVTVTPAVIDRSTTEVTVEVAVPLNTNGLVTPRFTRGRTLQSRSTLRTERVSTR
ncbi:TadE-like protein [Posidoniimonas corsicana]|uniref:TadE-like protein n=1 Tax=Posidoniimonas corsicana TaxID=1938618 RepID=A0A5C5UZX7_9BACT|nr:TadE/TadG family type IV pilus assembly protein [Posidoniimonas corsicana]TWT31180.1 TadE-like protein [Posidoniimonas corsicana]